MSTPEIQSDPGVLNREGLCIPEERVLPMEEVWPEFPEVLSRLNGMESGNFGAVVLFAGTLPFTR